MGAANLTTLAPIAFQQRHDLIQQRLKDYIVQNRLQPGDRLPTEEVLANQLGVSRTAIREALRGLEALGMLGAQQGLGRVVLAFSFEPILENLSYGFAFLNSTILQITEIRKALDAYFVEQAMARLTDDDMACLAQIVEAMKARNAEGQSMEPEDYSFHALLYERCGNPLAHQLFEITWRARSAALDRPAAMQEVPPGTAGEHEELLAAIREHDVERARRIIVSHHWNAEERFRREIAQGSQRMEKEVNGNGTGEGAPRVA
ncbi:MAG: FCD domain-containing protein [Anaerolineae bacterium]|jgi:DNA-binding FadR family transcriptional regulator|nr:FCD domain-containing protein [Anaerolineae bacterium]